MQTLDQAEVLGHLREHVEQLLASSAANPRQIVCSSPIASSVARSRTSFRRLSCAVSASGGPRDAGGARGARVPRGGRSRDHRARRDPEPLADGVLGLALEGRDGSHQGELARVELHLGHEHAEAAGGLEPELGEQEPDRLGGSLGRASRAPGRRSARRDREPMDPGSLSRRRGVSSAGCGSLIREYQFTIRTSCDRNILN